MKSVTLHNKHTNSQGNSISYSTFQAVCAIIIKLYVYDREFCSQNKNLKAKHLEKCDKT